MPIRLGPRRNLQVVAPGEMFRGGRQIGIAQIVQRDRLRAQRYLALRRIRIEMIEELAQRGIERLVAVAGAHGDVVQGARPSGRHAHDRDVP